MDVITGHQIQCKYKIQFNSFLKHSSISKHTLPTWSSGDMILNPVARLGLLLLYGVAAIMSEDCGPAEYKTGQQCCPTCSSGHYVKRHCTDDISTTCQPCPHATFTDGHNGFNRCFSCSVCDSSGGLRVKRKCSSTSDTLCEPLEGHYCTDPIKDGCRGAVEHTHCKPGQYINQTGTAFSDTVCGDCVGDTYSNGSFTSCRPHTRCESLGLFTRKLGTHTADTECKFHRQHTALWVPLSLVCILLVLLLLSGWHRWRRKSGRLEAT